MPVWHAALREWVEFGELVFLGIIQEQHPERCRLFAQWHELDFPILWDAFNLTGSKVVPNFVAIDEHGIVRSIRPTLAGFEEDFLFAEFEAPAQAVGQEGGGACAYPAEHGETAPHAALLQRTGFDAAVEEFEQLVRARPADGVLAFCAGVARRMRYDSEHHRPDDFQAAVEHWTRALELDPNQYIWRRRIQQYGPRMDKPYPFYSWVEEARRAVVARGERPVALVTTLTPAELAEPSRAAEPRQRDVVEPDTDGRVTRDDVRLVSVESAVAFDTARERSLATVHLALRPSAARDVHWNHEAGPTVQVWFERGRPALLERVPRTDVATSSELQSFTFEVTLDDGRDEELLVGYALYYVCEGAGGQCLYLRQDFEVTLARPLH